MNCNASHGVTGLQCFFIFLINLSSKKSVEDVLKFKMIICDKEKKAVFKKEDVFYHIFIE